MERPEMRKKEVRLHNVMFPIWFLIIFPITWIIILPANFIIDSVVLLISARLLRLSGIKEIYKRSILRIWLIGFASDFMGAGILFLTTDSTAGWSEYLNAVSWNPFDNWYALLYVSFAVIISGICIYFGNLRFSFRNMDLEQRKKRILALALAVFTAPYILLYPSALMNGNSWDDLSFMTNHIVKRGESNLEVLIGDIPADPSGEDRINMSRYWGEMMDAVNEAEKTPEPIDPEEKSPDFTLLFYNRDYTDRREIPVWLTGKQGYFIYEDRWYAMDGEKLEPFLEGISAVRSMRGILEFEIQPDPRELSLKDINEELLEKDGKKEFDYPIFEDSRYRYYSPSGYELFRDAVIRFQGKDPMDIYDALEKGLMSPQDLIELGFPLIPEEREKKE